MKKLPLLSWIYIGIIFLLFLYSYTQVDLDLTFSRIPLLHSVIKSFQYIGYFQRPLSTFFYLVLIALLFLFYLLFLNKAKKNTITRKQVWLTILISTVILLFSYNAFSYDLFNYIFDAKIFTFYHLNPYLHKALDFPHDPMLTFMRWTHRTYPYGPVWLWLTVPLSFLGLQLFIPTFLLFKLLMAGSYLGSIWFLEKIYRKLSNKKTVDLLVFYGLHPLLIIESLISGHNDIVMMFMAIISLYFLMNKQYLRSFILLFLSIGIKFSTLFLLPVFMYIWFAQSRKQQIQWERILLVTIILMVVPVVIASYRANFQTWYLIWILPFAALLKEKYYVAIPAIAIPLFSLLIYAPYLYLGNWDPPVPIIIFWEVTSGIILSTTGVILIIFKRQRTMANKSKQLY